MYDPTPICIPCKKEMRCLKNSVSVLYLFEDGEPYKIHHADLYECVEKCGNRQLKGFSTLGVESWQPEWEYTMINRNRLEPEYQIEVRN
jgi:hypothetical protein